MFNFNTDKVRNLELLVQKQEDLIDLYRDAVKERDNIIKMQKRLLDIMQQQIDLEKEKNETE